MKRINKIVRSHVLLPILVILLGLWSFVSPDVMREIIETWIDKKYKERLARMDDDI